MGTKGDRETGESAISAALLQDKLSAFEGITNKKMFGGHGISHEGKMFGLIDSKGKTFFKADEEQAEAHAKLGSEKHSKMPYYSIPEKVFNDQDLLSSWAEHAIKTSK